MNQTQKTPLTNSQRVRRAKLKAVSAGGRRAPDGILTPDVARALDALIDSGYATSAFGAVSAALLDAHRKIDRSNMTIVKMEKKIK
jgi:hypothetical protein